LNLKSSIESARCDGRKTLKSVSQVNSGVDRKDPNNYRRNPRIIEEIITALSRIRWIFVIARNSSFTYKGQPVDVKKVGRELGVRYVLEGSVRKAGQPVAHHVAVDDIAAVLDPSIERPLFRALSAPNEMANQWCELGLLDVEQTSLLIRMKYFFFDDYWLPLTSDGPVAQFVAALWRWVV
jgi:hypothetical protein